MEKLFILNRLYGIAISAGMLTSVLFLCSCKTSKESLTTAHLDSTQYSVTVVSTIEPVPTKLTDLLLTPDHLTRLTQLPKGYSLQAPTNEDGGADIRVESDGKGGLNIVAETSPMVQRKDSTAKEIETHIRDETTETTVKNTGRPPFVEIWIGMMLVGFIMMYVENKLKNN